MGGKEGGRERKRGRERKKEREGEKERDGGGKIAFSKPLSHVCLCDRVEIASRRLRLDVRTDYKTAKEREKELFEKQKRDILMGKGPRRSDVMP
jgi:hypothetical protein